jgi:hypothetical protein
MGHIVTITKVDNIERFLTTHGHTLECDECGEQYNGGNDEDKGGPLMPNGYRGMSPSQILDHGEKLGWTGLAKYHDWTKIQGMAPPDLCPVCSAMKKAPYWATVIHEPDTLTTLRYEKRGPILQTHSIVMPLERREISITTRDWPERDRYNVAPAVMMVKVIGTDDGNIRLGFDTNVRWIDRKPGFLKGKSHLLRLWSWGDNKVYVKEVSPKR